MGAEREIIKGMQVKGGLLGLLMVAASALFGRWDVFFGMSVGVLLAYGDFLLLCLVAGELLELRSQSFFWMVQIFKYLIIGTILAVLFFKKLINPVATVCGLSLIMVIPFTEVLRLKKT